MHVYPIHKPPILNCGHTSFRSQQRGLSTLGSSIGKHSPQRPPHMDTQLRRFPQSDQHRTRDQTAGFEVEVFPACPGGAPAVAG